MNTIKKTKNNITLSFVKKRTPKTRIVNSTNVNISPIKQKAGKPRNFTLSYGSTILHPILDKK